MSEAAFEAFLAGCWMSMRRSMCVAAEEVPEAARATSAGLLPKDVAKSAHYLWVIVDADGDERVGLI